jgi:hypothetical protein
VHGQRRPVRALPHDAQRSGVRIFSAPFATPARIINQAAAKVERVTSDWATENCITPSRELEPI